MTCELIWLQVIQIKFSGARERTDDRFHTDSCRIRKSGLIKTFHFFYPEGHGVQASSRLAVGDRFRVWIYQHGVPLEVPCFHHRKQVAT